MNNALHSLVSCYVMERFCEWDDDTKKRCLALVHSAIRRHFDEEGVVDVACFLLYKLVYDAKDRERLETVRLMCRCLIRYPGSFEVQTSAMSTLSRVYRVHDEEVLKLAEAAEEKFPNCKSLTRDVDRIRSTSKYGWSNDPDYDDDDSSGYSYTDYEDEDEDAAEGESSVDGEGGGAPEEDASPAPAEGVEASCDSDFDLCVSQLLTPVGGCSEWVWDE